MGGDQGVEAEGGDGVLFHIIPIPVHMVTIKDIMYIKRVPLMRGIKQRIRKPQITHLGRKMNSTIQSTQYQLIIGIIHLGENMKTRMIF